MIRPILLCCFLGAVATGTAGCVVRTHPETAHEIHEERRAERHEERHERHVEEREHLHHDD